MVASANDDLAVRGMTVRHDGSGVDGRPAWKNAIAVGICGAFSQGVLFFYCFGIFVTPISQSLGTSPGLVGAAVSPAIMIMALLFPVYGMLIDRWGVRRVVLAVLVPYTLCAAAIGTASSVQTLTLMLIATSVIGAPINPSSWVPVVCQWFSRYRGLALGISTGITGIGVAFMPILAAWLLTVVEWRFAIGALAAIFSVAVGLCLIFVVRSPPRQAIVVANEGEDLPGLDLKQAMRSRLFYVLCASFFLMGTALGGAVVHLPSYLRSEGITLYQVSFLMATLGISNIASRLLVGGLFDRAYVPYISSGLFLCGAIGLAIFATSPGNFVACTIAVAMLGAALGAETADIGYLVSAGYGPRHNGKLFGAVLTFYSLGQGAGAGIIGFIYEAYGYRTGYITVGIGCIVAMFGILLIRPRHLPFYPRRLEKGDGTFLSRRAGAA